MNVQVLEVPDDDRPCPVCSLPLGDDRKAVSLSADGVRWGHTVCLVQANGGVSAMAPRRPEVACA